MIVDLYFVMPQMARPMFHSVIILQDLVRAELITGIVVTREAYVAR